MMTSILMEEEALRRAVQTGDFAEAERSARRYTGALKAVLPQLLPAQAQERLGEACRLVEWARRCLCAARARLNGELRRVRSLSAYRQAAAKNAVHTWRIDG